MSCNFSLVKKLFWRIKTTCVHTSRANVNFKLSILVMHNERKRKCRTQHQLNTSITSCPGRAANVMIYSRRGNCVEKVTIYDVEAWAAVFSLTWIFDWCDMIEVYPARPLLPRYYRLFDEHFPMFIYFFRSTKGSPTGKIGDLKNDLLVTGERPWQRKWQLIYKRYRRDRVKLG